MTALSSTNAWAVGEYCTTSTCAAQETLILHWNGTAWSKIKSPSPSSSLNYLYGVSATSSSDAWAVGHYLSGTTGAYDTLILHWNGTTWAKVKSPNPSLAGGNFLFAVGATSSTNVWAVGDSYASGSNLDTLTLHWNGTGWAKIKSPNPGSTFNGLNGVSVTSAGNAWAAGTAQTPASTTLVLHWNGTAWSKAASPSPTGGASLAGVSATSGTNAWAVGAYCASGCSGPGAVFDTLTLHWNGTGWAKIKSPNPSSSGPNLLSSLSATSAANAWAVGSYPNSSNAQTTLILHWNGTSWSKS